VQSSWAADSIEPQAESNIRDREEARSMRIFDKFIPQVYWILGAGLRESVYLSYLYKLSNNRAKLETDNKN
jgi:hypothetical protein